MFHPAFDQPQCGLLQEQNQLLWQLEWNENHFFFSLAPTLFIEEQNDENVYRLTHRQTDHMKDRQTDNQRGVGSLQRAIQL